jgi:Bacterial transcriptional regulator
MVIQETTHARSPLSIDRGMIGKRLPMLRTSAGRAYLAASAPIERDVIINHLRRIDEADDRRFLEPNRLSRMIAETSHRGYAIRNEGEYNPKTSSSRSRSFGATWCSGASRSYGSGRPCPSRRLLLGTSPPFSKQPPRFRLKPKPHAPQSEPADH